MLLRHNDTKKAGYLLVQSQQQAGGRKRGGMRTWSRDKQPKPKAAMTENAGQEKFVVLISDRLLLYDKVVAGNESGASSGGGVDGVKAMELGLAETLLLEGLTVALSVGGAKAGQVRSPSNGPPIQPATFAALPANQEAGPPPPVFAALPAQPHGSQTARCQGHQCC